MTRVRVGHLAAAALAVLLPLGTAHAAADARKVVRDVFPVAETGFDPAAVTDLYSAGVIRAIFDTLLTYDYLARPAKLVPRAAEAMPQATDDGRTWTVKVRRGIHFTPDPAFGGTPRELTAADVVYAFKRLADPKLRSPCCWPSATRTPPPTRARSSATCSRSRRPASTRRR